MDIELDLDDEMIAELQRIAEVERVSAEDVALRAVRDYLAKLNGA